MKEEKETIKRTELATPDLTVREMNRKAFVERLRGLMGDRSARSFAALAGIPATTFNKVASGQSEPTRPTLAAIARAANVSLDWLATGEGVQPIDFTETLDKIERRLERAVVPIAEPRPQEWQAVYDELMAISQNPGATDNCRLRAETLLRLAFNDKQASIRFEENLKDMGARLREGRAAYAAALKAVGWEPPQAIGFAIADAMVMNGLDYDGAVAILTAMRDSRGG